MDSKAKFARKRPEMAIYRPGMGKLLGKKNENEEESQTSKSQSNGGKDGTVDSTNSAKNQQRKKRPTEQKDSPSRRNVEVNSDKQTHRSDHLSERIDKHRFSEGRSQHQAFEQPSHHERASRKPITSGNAARHTSSPLPNKQVNTSEKVNDKRKFANLRPHGAPEPESVAKDEPKAIATEPKATVPSSTHQSAPVLERVSTQVITQTIHPKKPAVKSIQLRSDTEPMHIAPENTKSKTITARNEGRNRNRKGSNRSDYKYEQNLPPRLQKLVMEKKATTESATHSAGSHQRELRDQHPGRGNSSENSRTRGVIHLPPDTSLYETDRTPSPQQHISSYSSTQCSGTSSTRTLFDPYRKQSKPCVAIKPTPQIPQQQQASDMSRSHGQTQQNTSSYSSDSGSWPRNRHVPQIRDSVRLLSMSEGSNSPPTSHGIPISANAETSSFSDLRRARNSVENNLKEAKALEAEFEGFLSRMATYEGRHFEEFRWKIRHRYENVILADCQFCAEHDIEQMLWKSVFYQFIEIRRKCCEENSTNSHMKDSLLEIIDEGTVFFETLIAKVQDNFEFSVEKYIEHEYDTHQPGFDKLKLVAFSAQKLFMYLGDLARYKETAVGTSGFGRARSHYQKAQLLAPKNGSPYFKLALLAMYSNRRLDAVYFYMRSLAASTPFAGARERLIAIFDDIRKKYEDNEKKALNERLKAMKLQGKSSTKSDIATDERLEIWIRPDGSAFKQTNSIEQAEDIDEAHDLKELTDANLNKRFVLSFLHVHGKLFSKIGMENFTTVVDQMLLEFSTLLRRSPTPIGSQRLLQLMAINMFSIQHTSLKNQSYGYESCRPFLQEQALHVTFSMVSLILEKAISSLKNHLIAAKAAALQSNLISDDCAEMLPSVKIWTDWMSCQKQLWSPPPGPSDFKIGGDIWNLFAELLTLLTDVNTRSVKLLPNMFEGCEPVILPEDNMLAGFTSLLGAPRIQNWCQPPYDKEKARNCFRITRVQFFGDYLCGMIPQPYLEFDVGRKCFKSLVTPSSASTATGCQLRRGGDQEEEEVDEESEPVTSEVMSGADEEVSLVLGSNHAKAKKSSQSDNEEVEDIPADKSSCEPPAHRSGHGAAAAEAENEVKELWKRKEALAKVKQKQEQIQDRVNALLDSEHNRQPLRLVVRPRFLVPDTNCFIDHLDALKDLLDSGLYELDVPLIVINELRGLGSGNNASKSWGLPDPTAGMLSDGHQRHVAQAAGAAVLFLERAFVEKKGKIKTVTTKGSLLDTMNFTNESPVHGSATNADDLVLSSCLQLVREKNPGQVADQSKDQPGGVSKETSVVLLTDDRNLRVKALSHELAVKSPAVFCRWAHVSETNKKKPKRNQVADTTRSSDSGTGDKLAAFSLEEKALHQ